MAEPDSPPPPQLNLPSFVVNLFPFLKPKSPANVTDGGPKPTGGDKETQNSTVSFPYNPPKSTEPLKVEAEPSSGTTSNSLVIWQVYALGGFLVLKWAWARWNERNEKKKSTDDDDDQAPHPEDD
ncbi:hypothetical protein Rs2_29855 [Raphanus sativus]|uniref:Uncharacterized protein LOC108811802 n=1 Tax=Raphanus sativus TaxID=3726 RepID=A0A6J0JUJ3_RAPSA|nr:uncharacterized protein LOC108811802 [Raphanus sativus]XP_018439396.1 PREDICTED: uncharacterized protein LOC108811803 [Raphanus sativus]XP_056845088.1 uncharacterized protein LOC108811802 [Raphanus sativus]KAJ4890107.1 hypothetical protein Rs2_29855 [Raphanus sativus]